MSLYTVVGAAGYVGARLVRTLRSEGYEVYAPSRGDPDLFTRDLGRVFYCAGLTADYLARPFDTVEAHVTLLARMLQTARFERLVYLSSTRLYDSLGARIGAETAALSLRPSEPRHLYDFSTGLGETLCLTQGAGRCAVARLSCVFDEAPGSPGFLPEWIDRARRERSLTLASAPAYVRDYIHLDDTVAALRAILDSESVEVVNVASGENVSNAELAAVFEGNGWTIGFEREVPPQSAPVCTVERLGALGVTPRPVRQIVDRILKEFSLASG